MKQTPVRPLFKPVEFNPATPPNRRALSKLRTRLKVLEAARDLFIERGYEAATVRDNAGRAGMSTGAVFANFEDKSGLFEAIVREDLEQVPEAMRAAALGANGSLVEKITQAFAAGYAFH